MVTYRISGIFRVGKIWRKWRFEGVLNFHWVLFSLFQGLSMKTYNRGLFFAVSIFGDFRELANSAKIKPTRKIPDIRVSFHWMFWFGPFISAWWKHPDVIFPMIHVCTFVLVYRWVGMLITSCFGGSTHILRRKKCVNNLIPPWKIFLINKGCYQHLERIIYQQTFANVFELHIHFNISDVPRKKILKNTHCFNNRVPW